MRHQPVRYVSQIAALLVLFALVLLPAGPVGAGGAQLTFEPAETGIPLGGSGNVVIMVANVNNLGGYDLFIQFDPAVVNMTALNDLGFVTGGGNIVVCNSAMIDNVAGSGSIFCATIAPFGTPVPGVSTVSAQPMVHASFMVVGAGVSLLTMTGTELQDPNGAQISASLSSGSITSTAAAVGGVAELADVQGEELAGQTASSGGMSLVWLIAIVTLAAVSIGAACTAVGVPWLRSARR